MWLMRPLLQHCSSCVKSSFETEMLLLNVVDLSEPMPPGALTVQTIRHRSTEGAVSDTNHFWSPKDHALNKLYSTLRLGSLTRGRTQRIKLLRKYRFGHSWWVILKRSISITAWLGNWWLFAANRMPQGDFATKHKTLYGVIAVTSERCYLCVRSYRKNWKHPLMSWPPRPVCEQFMMFMCPSSQQTVMFVSDLSWNLCRVPRSKNRVTAVSRLDSQCITIVSPSCHHRLTIVSPSCHHRVTMPGLSKGQGIWKVNSLDFCISTRQLLQRIQILPSEDFTVFTRSFFWFPFPVNFQQKHVHILVSAGLEGLRRLDHKKNDQHNCPSDNQQGSSLRAKKENGKTWKNTAVSRTPELLSFGLISLHCHFHKNIGNFNDSCSKAWVAHWWFPDPFRHSQQMANKKPGKPISDSGPRSRCKL